MAQEILGHQADDIVGRKCYDVCDNHLVASLTPACIDGCPSLKSGRQGKVPAMFRVWMLCASGSRKLVSMTPLIIPWGEHDDELLLIHLFGEDHGSIEESRFAAGSISVSENLRDTAVPLPVEQGDSLGEDGLLTSRELEVLRLVARSTDTNRIPEELRISPHTVLNHVRNARRNLKASNRLDAVLTAQRLGLL